MIGNADKMDVDEEAPVPPPHKSAPASPVVKPAPTPEEAEAFKNQGNAHYKAREYGKAIAEYTKGKSTYRITYYVWSNIVQLLRRCQHLRLT